MKSIIYFCSLLALIMLFTGCGKPSDPETVTPVDNSGGYKVVCRLQTYGYAQDICINDSLAYLVQGEGGLMVLNIKNPAIPQILSVTTEGAQGYSTKIAQKDSVVYLAAGTFGVTAINVADPLNPFVSVSNISMKPSKSLHVMGQYLFAAVSENGVKIASIEFPSQPDIRGGMATQGYARGIANSADSNNLFVACGEMGLSIFDISDFQQGYGDYELSGWCDTPGYAESVVLDDQRAVAFVACGTAGLQIIDYADLSHPKIIAVYNGAGYAKELLYRNNRIYLTAEKGGLQIIDVSNMLSPVRIGQIDLQYPLGIDADDHYLYIADEIEGLVIVSIP